jgi:rfaE bifunctional protein nucleotidyltransferase chain/domain
VVPWRGSAPKSAGGRGLEGTGHNQEYTGRSGTSRKAATPCKADGVPQNSGVRFREKIIGLNELPGWREKIKASGKRLVVTNGCFDLLHIGHVTYLEQARQQGDLLLLGLNGDDGVHRLKGPNRPVVPEGDRAAVMAALESVNAVCIFPEETASNFLYLARPDIYVKGGDYTPETLNQEERRIVEQAGAKIVILPFVPGNSTTELLKKIARL